MGQRGVVVQHLLEGFEAGGDVVVGLFGQRLLRWTTKAGLSLKMRGGGAEGAFALLTQPWVRVSFPKIKFYSLDVAEIY